ncbi:MAG: methyltransferase domain-containing protein [Deltaproteobacteria bacterium]|nr:methyltransferase domain-containing protein [Deltaproteobacteria bacterium]
MEKLKNQSELDVREIMSSIRERVKEHAADQTDSRLPFVPQATDFSGSDRKAGELLHSEELRYLNQHHTYSLESYRPDKITSHRKFLGKFIVKLKRKMLSFLWENLLKDYFQAEKEFQSNLVKYLNDSSKYIDSRDAFIFWDLIKKVDTDVNRALERIERINDEQTGTLVSTERRVINSVNHALEQLTKLDTEYRATAAQVETLESVSRGLERILSKVTRPSDQVSLPSNSEKKEQTSSDIDYTYLMLENRYRGSEQSIKDRMSVYLPYFKNCNASVVEIGPGRGELQTLFVENQIPSYGVEMDQAMVEACKEKGLDVRLGDGIEHIVSAEEDSLGGVIACQVIEHLTQDQLVNLAKACLRAVKPGGKIIFETINTESMVALARNYFRDPTHVFPLHPETMRFFLELCGLKVLEVKKLSPYSDEAVLQELPVEEYMTPRWAYAIETLNRNIRRLNELLYGYQDYCIVAEVE